ncbi:MAG: hypothetical protein GY811_03015 [Myxococcales bacterium]|nr:hypothetical protein [Myxococcales bacterium]
MKLSPTTVLASLSACLMLACGAGTPPPQAPPPTSSEDVPDDSEREPTAVDKTGRDPATPNAKAPAPSGPMRHRTERHADMKSDVRTVASGLGFHCVDGSTNSFKAPRAKITLRLSGGIGGFPTTARKLVAYAPRRSCAPYRGSDLNSFKKVKVAINWTKVDYYRPSGNDCYHFVSTELAVKVEGVDLTFRGSSQTKSTKVDNDKCR